MENTINLKNRQQLSITGVEHVYSFNDVKIELKTNLGDMKIEGEKLDMGKLSIEEGMLNINGAINCIVYSKTPRKDDEGFFKRLFK